MLSREAGWHEGWRLSTLDIRFEQVIEGRDRASGGDAAHSVLATKSTRPREHAEIARRGRGTSPCDHNLRGGGRWGIDGGWLEGAGAVGKVPAWVFTFYK